MVDIKISIFNTSRFFSSTDLNNYFLDRSLNELILKVNF